MQFVTQSAYPILYYGTETSKKRKTKKKKKRRNKRMTQLPGCEFRQTFEI